MTASGATAAASTSPALAAAVEKYRAYVAAESDALLDQCTIRDCAYSALDLASYGGAGSLPAVTSCGIAKN